MSITLQDFANGDTNYVGKMNSNNDVIESAVGALQDAVAGAAVELLAPPYSLQAFFPGVPANSALMLQAVFSVAVTLPEDLAGSYAIGRVAATAATTITLKKNGVSIGTIEWAMGETDGTFTFAAAVAFAAGDVLTIHNQASADATLEDISITLHGTRVAGG